MTTTPFLGLTEPAVGGDVNVWGGELNNDLVQLDKKLGGTLTLAVTGDVTLTSDQAQYGAFNFVTTLTAAATITFPSSFTGTAVILNNESAGLVSGWPISVRYASGTIVNILPNETKAIWGDGSNFERVTSPNPSAVVMTRLKQGGNNPSTNPTTWVVFKPNGTLLDLTGTTTQGLQEAINFACNNGYELYVYGGAVRAASSPGAFDGQNPAVIDCTTGIVFPPMQLGYVYIGAVTINVHGAANIVGITFNSMLNTVVDLCKGGQIVVAGSSATGVKFAPTNPVPQDNLFGTGISGSFVFVNACTMVSGGTSKNVVFDTTSGPIELGNVFTLGEINSGDKGIVVVSGPNAFSMNTIEAKFVHAQTTTCVEVGQSSTNSSLIGGNQWDLMLFPGSAATAFDTWAGSGGGELISVGAVGLPSPLCLNFRATSFGNIVNLYRASAFTTLVADASSSRNTIHTQTDTVLTDLGGVDQGGFTTGNWFKINFSHTTLDTATHWDNTNHRWVPAVPGLAQIDANIKYNAAVDQTLLRIAIYKNGILLPNRGEEFVVASGTGVHAVSISRLVRIDNSTDYFEIFARQDTGSTQVVSGDTNETYAAFLRLS